MQVIDPEWRELVAGKRDVLVALAIDGPDTGTAIHTRVRGDDPATEPATQRLLKQLEHAGYIEREVSTEDNRAKINRLTDEGHDIVERGVIDVTDEIIVSEVVETTNEDP